MLDIGGEATTGPRVAPVPRRPLHSTRSGHDPRAVSRVAPPPDRGRARGDRAGRDAAAPPSPTPRVRPLPPPPSPPWTAARRRSAVKTDCAAVSSSGSVPVFSMTYSLCARLRSAAICAAIMRSASWFVRPRSARRRVRRSATGASTNTTVSNCAGSSTSKSSGMSLITIASPRSLATRCSSSRRCWTAGCTIVFSAASASSSPITLARSAARSRLPSAPRTSAPKRLAMAARTVPPGAWASRASTSASMIVAPHLRNSSTTVDLPEAMLPVRPTLSILKEGGLVFVLSRNTVTVSTPRFVRFSPTHHDDRRIPERRLAVDEPLIARRRPAADHADRLELVDHLGDAHQRRHRAEGEAPEVDVGAGQDDPHARVRQPVGDVDDAVVEELCFVDGDDLRGVAQPARDLVGGVDRLGFDRDAVVRGDGEETGIACI